MDADQTLPASLAGCALSCEDDMKGTQQICAVNDVAPSVPKGFIGKSPGMQLLYKTIQSAARSSASVFITGESGTGKDVCAQAVHQASPRASGPFVPINCAAIPRDLLESELFGHMRGAFTGAISDRPGAVRQANRGTLFLDEIGEMDPAMQTKLLRFLQDGTFQSIGGNTLNHADVRIICATNRDPELEIRAGRFRDDLFYRLHVLPIHMPPLRDRGSDVIDIANAFLLNFAKEENRNFRVFSEDAKSILQNYLWPGNIRQLQNVIRNAVVMHDGPDMTAAMLPINMLHAGAQRVSDKNYEEPESPLNALPIIPLDQLERRAIETAILACSGNVPRAAALLGVSPSTVYRKKAAWEQGERPG